MSPKSKSIISRIMEFWQLILLVIGILAAWYNMQTKVAVQQVQIDAQEKRIEKIEAGKGKMWEAISKKQDKP